MTVAPNIISFLNFNFLMFVGYFIWSDVEDDDECDDRRACALVADLVMKTVNGAHASSQAAAAS